MTQEPNEKRALNRIPATGSWVSPIRAKGAALRRLAPKLTGSHVELCYEDGRLLLNGTAFRLTKPETARRSV